jgi:hypothetical protein
MNCDQCQAAMINGVFCHEHRCPNARKTWDTNRQSWILYLECSKCGCDVEVGTTCSCHSEDWEPEEEEVGEEIQ